ncbi:unnamed protein product, partial [Meganyctiphanes norvegica]
YIYFQILLVVSALSANGFPTPQQQSYGLPSAGSLPGPIQSSGSSTLSSPSGASTGQGSDYGRPCNGDEIRDVLGKCVLPEVSRNIFVYAAPQVKPSSRPTPVLPKPEVHYNFVFVKTPDPTQQNDPIIVPPPSQKTLVYVLSKKQQLEAGNQLIHTPYNPQPRPEVFYVNYGEGDNPRLPGGVDLQTALSSAFAQGQNLDFQNNNFGNNQGGGNNNFGNNQGGGNNNFGNNQGGGNNNYVPNIIDGGTISGGLVSPVANSPAIDGGFFPGGIVDGGIIGGVPIGQGHGGLLHSPTFSQGGIVDGGIIGGVPLGQGHGGQIQSPTISQGGLDSGFGAGVPLPGQIQIDQGFGRPLPPQQPDTSVAISSPTISQGGILPGGFDSGFGAGIQLPGGQIQIDQGFGRPLPQQPNPSVVISNPTISQGGIGISSNQGYQNTTPNTPFPFPSPSGPPSPPLPPSRPTGTYITPN